MRVAVVTEWMDGATAEFYQFLRGRKAVTAHEICPTLKAAALVADGGTSRLLYDSRFSALLRYFIQLWQGTVPP